MTAIKIALKKIHKRKDKRCVYIQLSELYGVEEIIFWKYKKQQKNHLILNQICDILAEHGVLKENEETDKAAKQEYM